jgi:glycosyltransferase involved in cell wall biosynthesis
MVTLFFFYKNTTGSVKQLVEKAESGATELQELRQIARLGLTEKYSWERVTEQYLEVFHRLAKK